MTPGGLIQYRRFQKRFREAAEEAARKGTFDLIAAHWALPASRPALHAAKRANLPLVVHSHGTDVRLLSQVFLARRFASTALHRASRWTVVSSYLKKLAADSFPALTEKIQVAPLPTDPKLFWTEDITRRDPKLIVSVTRFVPQKRVEVLIDAAAELKKRAVEFKLEIYGVGPLEEELKLRAGERELGGIVSFFGPTTQTELRSVYNRAGIVALNSIKEGFGLTLVEGALCGALPVGVNSGGIPDIIEHEQTGFLAEPDNPSALADELARALENPERREALSQIARQNALERFTGSATARRYAEIYRQACGD
ncbi:MAG: glycosyltransferase family 4 protein, partial [Candidatus Zixiibacteriota bacterium]